MRGYNHALSGAAGWLAITSQSALAFGWASPGASVTLGGALLCAGAAMVPDSDHPEGTIAWSIPSVRVFGLTLIPSPTRLLTVGVSAISGGHRHLTHSVVGITIAAALAEISTRWLIPIQGRPVPVAAGVYAMLLVAFALKALHVTKDLASGGGRRQGVVDILVNGVLRSWVGPWVLAVGLAAAATWYGSQAEWAWFMMIVAVGAFLHVLGDSLTTEGVAWLAPLYPAPPKWLRRLPVIGWVVTRFWRPNGYFAAPILGDTDRDGRSLSRQRVLGVVMGLYVAYVVIYEVTRVVGASSLLV